MNGWQLVRDGLRVRLEQTPEPPRDGPYVSMRAIGLCGTDVQIGAGQRGDVARVLGHEGAGVLHGVPGGDRMVVFNPVDVRDQDSILGHSYDGLFRSWVPLSPRLPVESLQEVEPLEPATVLALSEPLGTVVYSWELIARSAPAGPLAVGVWGAGPLGLLHAGHALDQGHHPDIIEVRPERLAWARNNPRLKSIPGALPGQRDPRPLDVAIMCVPRTSMAHAVREAAAALRPGGTMVLVTALDEVAGGSTFTDATVGRVRRFNVCGTVDPEHGFVTARTHAGEPLVVTGHRGTSTAHLRAAQAALRADPEGFGSLVTHEPGPAGAVEVINRRLAGEYSDADGNEIVKVVVRADGPARG